MSDTTGSYVRLSWGTQGEYGIIDHEYNTNLIYCHGKRGPIKSVHKTRGKNYRDRSPVVVPSFFIIGDKTLESLQKDDH